MSSILVIEDNAEMRLILEQTLASAGYEVRTAEDGKQASSLFQDKPPDLVITDIYMPNKDGLEVIMELRGNFPNWCASPGSIDFAITLYALTRSCGWSK